jgi:putative GTP pyrophosphokinase
MNQLEYTHWTRAHRRLLKQMELNFGFFAEDVGSLNVHSITSRIKSYESAVEKSRRSRLAIDQMQDIAGLRIVVSTRSEVEIVRRFFTHQGDVKDLQIEADEPVQRANGYRSWHVVARFHGNYQRSVYGGFIEVQIPTVFEHAFNLISRAWVYKSKTTFAPGWMDRFRELSRQLANLDTLAAELHAEVVQSADRAADDAPLSPLSYLAIMKRECEETTTLDDAVDSCLRLVDVGIVANGDLVRWCHDPEVAALWDEFQALATIGNARALSVVRSKRGFWEFHGLRLEVGKCLLEEVRKESVKT